MQSYDAPHAVPAHHANKPWSFGVFALGFFAWMTIGNGVVTSASLTCMYLFSNKGNPSAASLPFVIGAPIVVFCSVFALAIFLAHQSKQRALRDGFIVSAVVSVITTLVLLLLFGSAIFLFGARY